MIKIKIGFIGLGNMATAIIKGMLDQNMYEKEEIFGADISKMASEKAKDNLGIQVKENNQEVVQSVDVLFLAVKPMYLEDVIIEIREVIKKNTLIVSIVAGKDIAFMENKFEREVKIIRTMPNTPAFVSEGCTGMCKNKQVTEEEGEIILQILSSVGKAYEVPENLMDTVVGVSGSSPAYVFMFIEAMADAAVLGGMPRAMAYDFAAQSVLGSAKMVLETKKHPGELKDMVCSPGGTTIEAVKVLEDMGMRAAVMNAMEACIEKSKLL